nr:integrase, catalytic region, zinc finger, CCHC-type, peptidase aspartic, catalytic [Tanacetum cinerariifolium]
MMEEVFVKRLKEEVMLRVEKEKLEFTVNIDLTTTISNLKSDCGAHSDVGFLGTKMFVLTEWMRFSYKIPSPSGMPTGPDTRLHGRMWTRSGTNPRGGGVARFGGVQNRVENANPGQARQVKCYNYNGIEHIARNYTQPKHPQNSNYYKDKMLLMQAQEKRVALYEDQLLFLVLRLGSVLSQDFLHFVSRPHVFCLKTWLRFVPRSPVFCLKTWLRSVSRLGCVLSQDLLRFVSRLIAFCLKAYCVLPTFEELFLRFGRGVAGFGGVQNRVGNANPGQARQVKCYNCNGIEYIARNYTQPKHPQNSNYYKDKMLLMQAQEKRVALYEDQLLFLAGGHDTAIDEDVYEQPVQDLALNVDNVFQADDCDVFDFDLNSKFVNNMLPEWGRFVTAVKLNRGLRDSNYDQRFAYLKQHEAHAKENKMILECFSQPTAQPTADPLALLSNVSNTQYGLPSSSITLLHPPHANSSSPADDLIENLTNTLALLTQSYRTFLPQTNNQLQTSSNARNQATIQDGRVVVQNVQARLVQARTVKCYSCKAQENGVALDAEQLLFLSGGPDNAFDDDVDKQPVQDLALNVDNVFQAKDCNAFDSDAQPALYNGHEILKDNHPSAKVHNTEDTLEIAEITREKMNAKMTDPECVTHKGIQKALTKEVKEIKDVFEELEAEVAQCAVDRKHEAIDLKNLLIVNDNLITECLSKEVFSVATKSELNVALFAKMHVANTSIKARCLAFEAELATLREKSHQENQGELIKHFYKLEGKDNAIRQLKKQLSQLQVTRSDTDRTLRVQTIDSQITKLTDHVTHLQEQNDMAENDKIKQHYKELYDSIKITHAKHIEQVTKLTTKNVNLKTCVSKAIVNPQVSARDKHAIDVEPIVPRLRNNRDAHLDYLRHLKESVETIRDIVEEAKVVVQIILWYLDSGYSKHMMGDRSWLMNFVKKFIGIVRFENDHFGAIMGYGDYVIGDSIISRVYYMEGLGHNLFFVGQFCDADLEVAFRKHSCYVRDTNGVKLIKGSRPAPMFLTHGHISSGLVPNLVSATPYVPPINKDLEILFQPMFDEYLEPPRVERPVSPAQAVQAPVNSADTPSSTTID